MAADRPRQRLAAASVFVRRPGARSYRAIVTPFSSNLLNTNKHTHTHSLTRDASGSLGYWPRRNKSLSSARGTKGPAMEASTCRRAALVAAALAAPPADDFAGRPGACSGPHSGPESGRPAREARVPGAARGPGPRAYRFVSVRDRCAIQLAPPPLAATRLASSCTERAARPRPSRPFLSSSLFARNGAGEGQLVPSAPRRVQSRARPPPSS